MYYISIDNDYHFELASRIIQASQIEPSQIVFISHNNPRNKNIFSTNYKRTIIEGHPLCSGAGYKNPFVYLKSVAHQCRLRKVFECNSDDILILLTEYQLNNAILARRFSAAGSKVYLFDDGIGFYINNIVDRARPVEMRNSIYLFIYNFIYKSLGIPAIAKQGFEGRMHVRIRDEYIQRLYSRLRLPLDRDIPIVGFKFAGDTAVNRKRTADVALFLANNLSAFDLKDEEMHLSALAIKQMADKFRVVYVKLHPADWVEKTQAFWFYNNLVNSYKNIELVSNDRTSNQVLKDINPCVVVGTLGAGMVDALFMGYPTIFVFQLLSRPAKFKIFADALENLLHSVSYRFIKHVDEIDYSYVAMVDVDKITFHEELVL